MMEPAPTVAAILRAEYEAGRTLREISKSHDLAPSKVRQLLLKSGLALRSRGRKPPKLEPGAVAELYESGGTVTSIAKALRTNVPRVSRALAAAGVKQRTNRGPIRAERRQRIAAAATARGITFAQWIDEAIDAHLRR